MLRVSQDEVGVVTSVWYKKAKGEQVTSKVTALDDCYMSRCKLAWLE